MDTQATLLVRRSWRRGHSAVLSAACVVLLASCTPPSEEFRTVQLLQPPELPIAFDPALRDQWNSIGQQQLNGWSSGALVVEEFDPSFEAPAPALYYVALLVQNHLQVNALNAWDVHWSPAPIFGNTVGQQLALTGRHTYFGDTEGIYVFAVVGGAVYNRLMQFSANGQPQFNSIVLLDVAGTPVTQAPRPLDYYSLAEAGFLYNGRSADDVATPEQPGATSAEVGAAQASLIELIVAAILLSDVAESVVDFFVDIANLIRLVLGTIDLAFRPQATLRVNVIPLTTDAAFVDAGGNPHELVSGWGTRAGTPVDLEGLEVRFLWGDGLLSFVRGHLDANNSFNHAVPANTPITVQLVSDSHHAFVTSFAIANDAQVRLAALGADSVVNTTISVQDHDINILAQVHDAHRYVQDVLGFNTSKVRVAATGIADVFGSFNMNRAFAPCVGHWGETPPSMGGDPTAIVDRWGSGGAALPGVTPGTAPGILDGLAGYDIVIPMVGGVDINASSRGIPTHEYGHYVFCDMMANLSLAHFDPLWLVIVAQTLAGQADGDELEPELRGAVLNEAFADFVAEQVVGGVNWTLPPNANFSEGLLYCDPASVDCMEDNIGGPTGAGIPAVFNGAFIWEVGRLVTILHDIFDGHPVGSDNPNNGACWQPVTTTPPVRFAAGVTLNSDAADDRVSLLGSSFTSAVDGWFFFANEEIISDFDGTFFHAFTREMRAQGVGEGDLTTLYAAHGPIPPRYIAAP